MMKKNKDTTDTFKFSLHVWTVRMILLLLATAGSFSLQAQLPTLNWAGQLQMSNGISSTYGLSGGLSISLDAAGNVYTVGNYYGQGNSIGTIDLDPGTNPGDTFILHAPANPFGATSTAGYISKLNAGGHFAWGQSVWSDHANVSINSVAADAEGYVYSIGGFQDTAHFDSFTLYAHLNQISVFAPADVFVSKQDAQGDFIWVKQIGGDYGDEGTSVALSANGNIVVLGIFADTVQVMTAGGPITLSSDSDNTPYVFVAALRPSTGDILWIKQLGDNNGTIISQAADATTPPDLALDAEGNIYLEGSLSGTVDFDPGPGSYPLSGDGDMVVCKLNSQGDFVWAAKTETHGNGNVLPSAIFADGAGNVYTTGGYDGKIDFDPGTDTFFLNVGQMNYHVNNDIFICKWNSGGNFGWIRTLKRTEADTALGTSSFSNYATSIFIDDLGNVYTTGSLFGYMDMNSDTAAADTLIFSSNATQHMGYIHKLDAQGNFQWAIPIKDKEGYYVSAANAIIKDDSGHLYVTGGFNGTVDFDPSGGTYNLSGGGAFVLKLNDTAGNSGVGISAAEMEGGNIRLYPNPAGNELWLKSNGKVRLKTVLVYNMLGQELLRENAGNSNLYRMEAQSLPPGLYLLKALLSDGHVAQGKFEVRR